MRYKELFSIRAVKKLPEVDFNAISNIPKDQEKTKTIGQ